MQQPVNIQQSTVVRAGLGQRDAQAELYRQYGAAMYNICTRMTGNQADAQDLLQESFIHAFRHLRQLKDPRAFGGWLKRIVVNQCIRFCKSHVSWTDLDETNAGDIADEEMEWWVNIPLALVHEAIRHLPDGCRQVFVLYVLEDFGHKAIAESLGISESTSKSQYQRARKLLRERITRQIALNG